MSLLPRPQVTVCGPCVHAQWKCSFAAPTGCLLLPPLGRPGEFPAFPFHICIFAGRFGAVLLMACLCDVPIAPIGQLSLLGLLHALVVWRSPPVPLPGKYLLLLSTPTTWSHDTIRKMSEC